MHNKAKPLIRYVIGDLGKVINETGKQISIKNLIGSSDDFFTYIKG